MIVTERASLNPLAQRIIRERTPEFGFGGLGAIVYYRTYSRQKENGDQEHWPDTIIRAIEGFLSIRKWWYVSNRLHWDEDYWQEYATRMAIAAFDMKWLPPGRGLQVGGSEFVYKTGAMAHQNCGATSVTDLSRDAAWTMNALMHGVGIGFDTDQYAGRLQLPAEATELYIVPDSREGWVESVRRLIESYERGSRTMVYDYSEVRPAGEPIRGFGGTASGPEPLRVLHETLRPVLAAYATGDISSVRVVTDVINLIGTCVVAGGVRRTAEIALGSPHDPEFVDLKNYERFPERAAWGWTSNNSVVLRDHGDFAMLPSLAERIRLNGEPGVINLVNIQQYGRHSEPMRDDAFLINPCGEQPLEDKEVCCLADVFWNRCKTREEFFEAIEFATTYASTITLLPTYEPLTNLIIAKNRRIGVSISGLAERLSTDHVSSVITDLRAGYRLARETNRRLAKEARVPESVRVTTIKPNGSTSQLTGASPGIHLPPYGRYYRRMRVQEQSPLVPYLIEAGLPYEPDVKSANTLVFGYPIDLGKVRGQRDVSLWQKGMMAAMAQRHWSDNSVSVTITFDPKTEGVFVEDFLAYMVPFGKAFSMLPELEEGAYEQMPYEAITLKQYEEIKAQIRPIDWASFGGSDGQLEMYCTNDSCLI